ncbi:phosphatidylcholine:ceramide cholinephosphotransferase 2-like isoform X2 [Planococcus citri]
MVEDGHLSNTYQYGTSTYYMDDLAKNNDSKNNNESSCIMAMDQKDDTDDETVDNNDRSTSNSMATVNCINEILPTQHLKSNSSANKNTSSSSLPLRPQPHHQQQQPYATRYGKMYSPDSNGSSHMERTPSQNFFDVTKEAGGGGHHAVERNFPQEFHKTIIAFLILIFNFFLTTTSLAVIHDKVPQYGPLPDTVLNLVEPQEWALVVSEIFIIVTTSIMLIIIVLHKHRFVIFRRLFLMLSLLYFMRSITMFVTVLPVSSKTYQCSPRENSTDASVVFHRSINLFFGMGLTINGKHTYCGDYIYSGHTTVLVMSYLMISEYSPKKNIWLCLRYASWCMSLIGVLMVLLSHSHYTVDVIVGYFVTTRLFWMYHTCANNQFLKKKSQYNYLSREWWFFIFQYFECNVKGPLQPLEYR